MVKLLKDIGQTNTVVIITLIAALAAVTVTAGTVLLLNYSGFDIRLGIAVAFAVGVPLIVTPPIAWVLVSLLLKISRMEEEMRDLASYDSLTGLLSRHAFFESANSHVSLANRNKSLFAVMLIDLDHFKTINDQYGHPAGDAVLRLFADVVNSVARRSDIVGRLGGEEFAIILPTTSTEEALEFSSRLNKAVDQAVLKFGDAIIDYTVSIGLTASSTARVNNLDNLLTRADLALYQAKRNGRNQTLVFRESVERAATG
jgi:diguanylate cyclase (GGDEF)-like protein